MVLEALLNPKKAERKPWELFFIGLVYASFSFLLSWWVFKEYISIIMVTLTAICSVPLLYNIIKLEEQKDENLPKKEYWLIKEHGKAVSAFTFLFMGFVAAFLVLFIILPSPTAHDVFSAQLNTISQLKSSSPTGSFLTTLPNIVPILTNNLKILIFCFLLSFFFGAGAIFVLTWNASVVAVAVGIFVRNNLLSHLSPSVAVYSQFISLGVVKYLTHGIFEIVAYFIGALAGGIISIAIIRHDFGTPAFKKTLLDSLDIMALSIIIIFVAAIIEVFLTPVFV
ncbi:stage II sporulation protein M [Candidatus Woesearchaeota archaeon]|nr:stage II sporulation protein M [Candidatus Woesearchaeota archaeon]